MATWPVQLGDLQAAGLWVHSFGCTQGHHGGGSEWKAKAPRHEKCGQVVAVAALLEVTPVWHGVDNRELKGVATHVRVVAGLFPGCS